MKAYFLVMAGGAVGSLARYMAGSAIMARIGGRFPWGTLLVNVTGSFLMGLIMTLLTERLLPHPNWRLILVIGFLGGYTTFSSFEYETYRAVNEGGPWIGVFNVAASILLGYIAVWAGAALVARST